MKPLPRWIYWLIALLPAALGIMGILLGVLPYATLRGVMDGLSPDGNFNSLKSWNADVFKVLFSLVGIVFLGMAALTGLQRWTLFRPFIKQLWADTGRSFACLRPCRDEIGSLLTVVVIMVLAVIYRLEYITSPLHHDEAYTFIAFARTLMSAVSDYHLPNNHVFHSILVYFSTHLFGIQPWAVRLPAFTAGVLLVPAAYWLARRLYDRWTALLAALLVAVFPILVNYSTNARGYTLVALFTLLTFSLGTIVSREKNIFIWGLISLLSALGFYTLPVMLFPFGILFAWLFLENQAAGPGSYLSKFDFLLHWAAAGLGAAILTLLFYTPILIYSGPQKLFENGFVAPLPWPDLLETLAHRFGETWSEWTFRIPLYLAILLAAGFILSLVFQRRLSTIRFPVQGAAILWIVVLILVQRPNAWAKVWLFLLPLMLIWSCAGIVGLLAKVRLKLLRGQPLALVVVAPALLVAILHAARLAPQLPDLWARRGSEETTILFVREQLKEQDLIVVAPPDDAVVWYYSDVHGISLSHFDVRLPFERVLVLVDALEGQTPDSVLAERGPDVAVLNVESARPLGTFGKLQVVEVPLLPENP